MNEVMIMKYFDNLQELINYVNKEVPINLEKIGEEIKGYLKTRLLVDWYMSSSPEYYTRTNMLIDSITASKAKRNGDRYDVEIYFDANKIVPQTAPNKGEFPAHQNITNGVSSYGGKSYGELLPIWIEKGEHSSIHSYIGIHMIENTKLDFLKGDKYLLTRMIELLKLKGFDIFIGLK